MTGRPLLVRALLLVAVALLASADLALAQAGSGGGSFGGGGGGGGGGFGGGGRGGSGSDGAGSLIAVLVIFAIVAVWTIVGSALRERNINKRRSRVHTAAAEAAEDDSYLAAEVVESAAGDLYQASQRAWDARDRATLATLVGDELMIEWTRRLDGFESRGWHNRVTVKRPPKVRYVGLQNRADDADDRVVVLIEAELQAYVEDEDGARVMRKGEGDEEVSLEEYWTLARSGEGWMVVSIEQAKEGKHQLNAELVPVPEADTERLRGAAVTELAAADAVPEGFTTADLATVDFDGNAREHALDLSVADGRFAPAVLEVAARRAVAAWADAVDGSDAELETVASAEAIRLLLHGGDASERTRLVVRGPQVGRILIAAVRVESEPALMEVDVELAGVRYVEDRESTDIVSGSRDSASRFTERWTLALDGPPEAPWRLVGVR